MSVNKLKELHKKIKACRDCPEMCGTPIHGGAVLSPIMLVGQAPGPHEAKFDRPFAYTSGKTLFKWFGSAGVSEEVFRNEVYISAVARCFPGKAISGKGDREPSLMEIEKCRQHLSQEVNILKPKLIIAVGKLAISEVLGPQIFSKNHKLADVVGERFFASFHGHACEVICLPHPSGVSRWPRTPEGQVKLKKALDLLSRNDSFRSLIDMTLLHTHHYPEMESKSFH